MYERERKFWRGKIKYLLNGCSSQVEVLVGALTIFSSNNIDKYIDIYTYVHSHTRPINRGFLRDINLISKRYSPQNIPQCNLYINSTTKSVPSICY